MTASGIDVHRLSKWEKLALCSAQPNWHSAQYVKGNRRTHTRLIDLGLLERVEVPDEQYGISMEMIRLTPAGKKAVKEIDGSDYDKLWTMPGRHSRPVDEYGFPIRES